MEKSFQWLFFFMALVVGVLGILLRKGNEWWYLSHFGGKCENKRNINVPPGNMGWPLVGNMWSFFRAFKYDNPDSLISNMDTRYGHAKIYKAFLFGNPCIILTTGDACKRVLTEHESFGPGWSNSILKLMGKNGFHGVSHEHHKRLRKIVSCALTGNAALSTYVDYIKDTATSSLDEWASMGQHIEFLTEMRRFTFKVIMRIILSHECDLLLGALENEFNELGLGLKAMAINLPGFAYHKALKAREKMGKILQATVSVRKAKVRSNQTMLKRDMLDLLLDSEDEDGHELEGEEIVDLIILFLVAARESSAHATTWAVIYLTENPQLLQKAKEEQEEIVRKRLPTEAGLSLGEIKQMKYLSKVINETLRLSNISFILFREAKADVEINGYTIPKGWKVLPWIRNVHMDPENYINPTEFNPSRWDDPMIKSRNYIPFGAGSRHCPGIDLAKLEMFVFLHYFPLDYKIERLNPGCKVTHIPLKRPVDNCLARIKKLK